MGGFIRSFVHMCTGLALAAAAVYICNSHKDTSAKPIQCANWKLVTAPPAAAKACSNVGDGNEMLRSDSASSCNGVTVVTVNKDGIVTTTAYDKFITGIGREYAIVSTNMFLIDKVMWREITQQWYEPCACPDGIVGCAVLHARLMEEKRFEIVDENKQKGAQYGE